MSSNNEQEKTKSRSDDNSSSLSGTEAASLPLRKRKNMDRSGGSKRDPSKPSGGSSSAVASSSKGRGRGGGKPSRGESNDDVDPKDRDPIVDKKFFDGRYCNVYYCVIIMIFSPPILTVLALCWLSLVLRSKGFVDDFDMSDLS